MEVAQFGQTDATVRRMKGKLRDVFEVRADGPGGNTYRAMYYPTQDADGPIAVLHIQLRLKRVKEVEDG